ADVARRVEATTARLERDVRASLRRAEAERLDEARRRLEHQLAPLREFLDSLVTYRRTFEAWLAGAREQAGRFADRIPGPPEPPVVPAAFEPPARGDDDALLARILGGAGGGGPPPLPADLAPPPPPKPPPVGPPPPPPP